MGDKQTITRKVQIIPVGDKEEVNRAYKYIRDAQYAQNRAYNILISSVYSAIISGKSKEEIAEIYTRGQRKPKEDDPEYSLYKYGEINFPVGLPIAGGLSRMVKQDLKKAKSDGLFKGNSALPNRRRTASLEVHGDYVRLRRTNPHRDKGLYHDYESHTEFLDALINGSPEVKIRFANGITFKVVFGNPYKSHEMRVMFQRIFEEVYEVNGSSIQFDKIGKKMMLNLVITIPKVKTELDESIVVGVDLGVAIPAVCAVNNSQYERSFIGSANDFLRVRTKLQAQRRRLSKALRNTSGGHGRAKKLRKLDAIGRIESNFAQTYNHMVSKRVVDFAVKNHAKYINVENLEGYDSNGFILRNWSFFQLQQYIAYKAAGKGIEVRKINPYHTSQICSCCGHWEEGQRVSQSEFVCLNPECKNYGVAINADFNAARNIAMSKDFV